MDAELEKRIALLEMRITRLDALVAMQNGLVAAIVETIPDRVAVIKAFVKSAELLPYLLGKGKLSAVELEAIQEARHRLLATIDSPAASAPGIH